MEIFHLKFLIHLFIIELLKTAGRLINFLNLYNLWKVNKRINNFNFIKISNQFFN